jgi:hypothetical protein
MKFCFKLVKVLPVLAVAACTTVPVSSIFALSRIDFTTTSIGDLRVAIEIPDAIAPNEGGVKMEVVAKLGAKEDKFTFKLVEEQAHFGMKGLLPFPQKGNRVYAYRLSDSDTATLVKLRNERLIGKKPGEEGSLGIGISAKEFCKKSNLQTVPLEVTTFLATSETQGFITLSKDFDLRSDKTIADSIFAMPPCKS